MITRIRNLARRRSVRTLLLLVFVVAAVTTTAACNGYASVDIGAPMKVGPVYVNPSIGFGRPL
jgi:hypothetical protein